MVRGDQCAMEGRELMDLFLFAPSFLSILQFSTRLEMDFSGRKYGRMDVALTHVGKTMPCISLPAGREEKGATPDSTRLPGCRRRE